MRSVMPWVVELPTPNYAGTWGIPLSSTAPILPGFEACLG